MFLFLVSQVYLFLDGNQVGSGIVSQSREHVHNCRIKDNEAVVQVEVIKTDFKHPLYNYAIEADSFTAWEKG